MSEVSLPRSHQHSSYYSRKFPGGILPGITPQDLTPLMTSVVFSTQYRLSKQSHGSEGFPAPSCPSSALPCNFRNEERQSRCSQDICPRTTALCLFYKPAFSHVLKGRKETKEPSKQRKQSKQNKTKTKNHKQTSKQNP